MTSSREEFLRVSHLAASGGQPASTTTPQSNMTRRRHLAKSAPHRASDNMSLKSKRPSCKTLIGLHLYIFVISSLLISISQLSCQTLTNSHEENGPRPAGDGAADALAPCNQKRQHQETGSRAGQQRALKHLDGPTLQQRANQIANPLPSTRRHLLNQQGARQQRQFNQLHSRSAALSEAPQTQPPPASEEFSLSSLTSSGPAPSSGQSEQGNATSYAMISNDSEALASGSAPVVAPPNSSLASNQLDALGNASLSTAITSTGSSVYKTETGETENTTPALAAETIGSPVAPQPFATTSSSVKPGSQAESPHPQQQQRQQARRIEESSTLVVDRHSSSPSDDNHLDGPGRAPSSFTAKSAISSMPSSTSIITPLVGPPAMAPQQQQAQQMISTPTSSSSSMVKPIYVVGNPIGDLDYSSTIYNEQQAAGAKQKTVDFAAAKVVGQPQRVEKRVDSSPTAPSSPAGQDESSAQENRGHIANTTSNYAAEANQSGPSVVNDGDRMNGPALVYSDGQLVAGGSSLAAAANQSSQATPPPPSPLSAPAEPTANGQQQGGQHPAGSSLPAPSPRLVQGLGSDMGSSASVLASTPRRPSLPPPVNQANAASGLRSPLSPSGPLLGQPPANSPISAGNSLQQPANSQQHLPNFYQTSPPYVGGASGSHLFANSQLASNSAAGSAFPSMLSNKQAFILASQQQQQQQQQHQSQQQQQQQQPPHISAIASQFQLPIMHTQQPGSQPQASITNQQAVGPSRRPLNITRVEHISAECSNDLIRAVIVFNGTFKGIIYSSGYVNDPTCLYVNGTGTTRYEFSIRLNQCGTLGRQELHQPTVPGEARRRDQVMWNTLSIQYNPVIEQEWDEHFRVSCEYGSDFWKTISFSPFNVETSTGSPVVFTINPPQCQMDVLLGHGMGPKIAVDGPVTVGDPLTLLIHMKSEKAGYDILVKNCVAHNGGKQRMQLIDSNGCVVNERFISPFRGTYNDNDLRHVTLYAYLKAFRFTGSPVLYLECEIHMCQSACPPQMCYWRRLSKRSVDNNDFEYTDDRASLSNITANELGDDDGANSTRRPVISDSLSLFKALQVRHEPVEPSKARLRAQQLQEIYAEDEEAQLVCYRHAEVMVFMATIGALLLLVLSVAITCCLRIRKMTRSQFKHSRMQTQAGSQSISPSLLSFDESCSQASPSLIGGFSGGPSNGQTPSISSFFLQRASDHLPANKPTKQQLANANLLFKQRQQNNPCHSSGNNIIRDKKSYPTSSGQAMTSANMYTFNT